MKRKLALLVNIALLVVAALVYTRLPDRVPTHWDMHGNVNGTMEKFPGAFLPSMLGILIWFLMPGLRGIDPRKESYEKFDATFFLVVNLVTLLMAMLEALVLAVGLGYQVDMLRAMMFGLGLMFAVLGNYMPRLRSNWWMGIRTPWTLSNEEVWRKTHRFGGRAFFVGGFVVMLSTLLPRELCSIVAIVTIMVAALVPAVYSYFIWRTEPTRSGGNSA
jgi:uncharacterized membrane protein